METRVGVQVTAPTSRVEGSAAGLIERAVHGDGDAFDAIARSFGDALYRRALAILRHESDAQDATQDAFIKAWRELPRLNDASRFDAWLDRILVNACRDRLRRRGRQQLREIQPSGDELGVKTRRRHVGLVAPFEESSRSVSGPLPASRAGLDSRPRSAQLEGALGQAVEVPLDGEVRLRVRRGGCAEGDEERSEVFHRGVGVGHAGRTMTEVEQ